MRNYLGDGNLVTLTTSAAIATGAGLLSGGFFGITCAPAGAGQSVECLRQGEFTVTKNSAEAWAVGDTIYWNNTTKVFTIASSGNTQVGFATEIAANPSSSGVLLLVPKPGGVVSAVTNPVTGGIDLSGAGKSDLLAAMGIPGGIVQGISQSASVVGGATPWTKWANANDFTGANWSRSTELTNTAKLVTAQSAANGPAMFRREGCSLYVDGALASASFGNIRNFNSQFAAGGLAEKTIGILVYWHRLNASSSVVLRVGASSSDYVTYAWRADANVLVEGWNLLLTHTSEPIGAAGASPGGQNDFQTAGSTSLGWQRGAGTTFDFATSAVAYSAIEVNAVQAASAIHNSHVWIEGLYYGGKDKPRLTIGFDISNTAGLSLAKSTMDKYGLVGYAATPTANGNPAAPAYLWNGTDVATLQSLYTAGWDIIQHSVTHNSMGNYSDDGMLTAEFDACRNSLIQIGCDRGADLFAAPNNSVSSRVVAAAQRAGVRWNRCTGPILQNIGLAGTINPLIQGNVPVSNQSDATRLQKLVDLMILYGASAHIYTHAIVSGASDSLNTNIDVFDAMCAYIRTKIDAGLLDVVTPSVFIKKQVPNPIKSIIDLPSRLPITPGVSPYSHINSGYVPYSLMVSGGTVSAIDYSKDGSTFDSTGQTAGQFVVNPGDRLRITYSVAPTVIQQRIAL